MKIIQFEYTIDENKLMTAQVVVRQGMKTTVRFQRMRVSNSGCQLVGNLQLGERGYTVKLLVSHSRALDKIVNVPTRTILDEL